MFKFILKWLANLFEKYQAEHRIVHLQYSDSEEYVLEGKYSKGGKFLEIARYYSLDSARAAKNFLFEKDRTKAFETVVE